MPPAGGPVRADALGTISKVVHERLVSEELGELLEELRPYEESLDFDSDEASLIRVARRDRDKEVNVPTELREAQTRAGAEAFPVWVEARANNDFELFRPYLERNIALRREYASCFEVDEPYDALLDDFEPGMKTQEVRDVFTRLREGLVPLVAELSAQEIDDSCLFGDFPVAEQREMQLVLLEHFGFREGSWRLDPVAHPFASSMGTSDVRMTTYYPEGEMRGIFAAMHEGGHALYEHNVDPALERTPLCRGTSLALHESQSRMFENLVGRSIQWWRWAYPGDAADLPLAVRRRRARGLPPRDQQGAAVAHPDRGRRGDLLAPHHPALRARAGADRRRCRRRPTCRASGTSACSEYLGVEVPDDAHGVLQDVHWSRGTIGYFSTYALGNVISVQIWDKVLEDVPDLYDHIERGDLTPLTDWLREKLWRHGRKFTPQETLERVVGGGMDPEPYLRYLSSKLGALAA